MKVSGPLSPLFAVPTTAGTGSECSLGAMVSDPERHEKFGIASPYLVPLCAVLDAELMIGLPPHITSSTGMDALTHAVESYIGNWASDYTNSHAEQAVKLSFETSKPPIAMVLIWTAAKIWQWPHTMRAWPLPAQWWVMFMPYPTISADSMAYHMVWPMPLFCP